MSIDSGPLLRRGPEANPRDAYPIPGYEHLSMDLRRDIYTAFTQIEGARQHAQQEIELQKKSERETPTAIVEVYTDLAQCTLIEQFTRIVMKIWSSPMTLGWKQSVLCLQNDHPLITRLAVHSIETGGTQSIHHVALNRLPFDQRYRYDYDPHSQDQYLDERHMYSVEDADAQMTDRLWTQRVTEAFVSDGPRAALEQVGIILFKECGYESPPIVADKLSARFPKFFPPTIRDYRDLLKRKKGNCAQKAEAIVALLDSINTNTRSQGEILKVNYDRLGLFFKSRRMSEAELNDDVFLRKEKEYMRKAGLVAVQFLEKGYCCVADLPDPEPFFEFRALQSDIYLFLEYSNIFVLNTLTVPHVRVIARCIEYGGAPKYYVIEPNEEGVIHEWRPQGEASVRMDLNANGLPIYYGDDKFLHCILARELNLPPEFTFYKDPPARKKTAMNMLTPTVHEPPAVDAVPETVEESLIIPRVVSEKLGEICIAETVKMGVDSPGVESSSEHTPSLESRSVLSRIAEVVKKHPYATAGGAFTAVLSGLLSVSEYERAQQDIAESVLDSAKQVDATPYATEVLARKAEMSTTADTWAADTLLAQPFAPYIADALDVASRAVVRERIMVTLDDSVESSASGKMLSLMHTETRAGTHHLTAMLREEVKTVGPSFWVPLIRKVSVYGEHAALNVVGEGLDRVAVASSFVDIWNRTQPTDARLHTLTVLINGERVFASALDSLNRTNSSFDTHFIVDPQFGRFVPTTETRDLAQDACTPHYDELPSQWRTDQAALWVSPLCR